MTTLSRGSADRHSGSSRRLLVVVIVVAAAVIAVGVGLFTTVGSWSGSRTTSTEAPSFSLPRLGGGSPVGVPRSGGGHGRAAVLLFMASWCGPCQEEIPVLASTVRQQQSTGGPLATISVIGVDTLDPTSSALGFVRRSGVTFPVGADTEADVTQGLFHFVGDPETVFIDGSGRITAIKYGPVSSAEFVRLERQALGQTTR